MRVWDPFPSFRQGSSDSHRLVRFGARWNSHGHQRQLFRRSKQRYPTVRFKNQNIIRVSTQDELANVCTKHKPWRILNSARIVVNIDSLNSEENNSWSRRL